MLPDLKVEHLFDDLGFGRLWSDIASDRRIRWIVIVWILHHVCTIRLVVCFCLDVVNTHTMVTAASPTATEADDADSLCFPTT